MRLRRGVGASTRTRPVLPMLRVTARDSRRAANSRCLPFVVLDAWEKSWVVGILTTPPVGRMHQPMFGLVGWGPAAAYLADACQSDVDDWSPVVEHRRAAGLRALPALRSTSGA